MLRKILIAALALAMLLPAAHAAPAPAARSYETRIMHDHLDDAGLVIGTAHGFDAVALDVREAYDAAFGKNFLVFRLTLAGGCNAILALTEPCPELTQTVQFSYLGSTYSYAFKSSDGGGNFTGDMDFYKAPEALAGGQFAVEGYLGFDRIGPGAAPGAELTEWTSKGYAASASRDNMTEGFAPGAPDPLNAAYTADAYTLRAPDYYGSVTAPIDFVEVSPTAGTATTVTLTVQNHILEDQEMRLDTLALAGLEARFKDDDGSEKTFLTFTLGSNESKEIDFIIRGTSAQDRSGTYGLRLTTALGGYDWFALAASMDVPGWPPAGSSGGGGGGGGGGGSGGGGGGSGSGSGDPTATSTETSTETDTTAPNGTDGDKKKKSPGAGTLVLIGVLGTMAIVARRRM